LDRFSDLNTQIEDLKNVKSNLSYKNLQQEREIERLNEVNNQLIADYEVGKSKLEECELNAEKLWAENLQLDDDLEQE